MDRHGAAAPNGSDPEISAEQAILDRAYARLEAMRDSARALVDVPSDAESNLGGTHQARYERDVRIHLSSRRLSELAEAEGGLCFGRIDREDGERLYIGRISITDENGEVLVVDWRAPAAEPFYRATAGDPMGLRRRRHFVLEGRRLVAIEDDLLSFDDGGDESSELVLVGEAALLASLRRARTGRMGDIVATIQAEQDRIIRAPLPGVLVVQGGPGTGKTAVALHRAAYLLYTHRFPLQRAGVLVVGPSRAFLRYIDRVLPALGEQAVSFATTDRLLPGLQPRGRDTPEQAALKADPRMVELVQRAVAQRQRPLRQPVRVLLGRNNVVLSTAASRRIVEQARRRRGTHNERRKAVEKAVTRELERQWVRQRRQVGVTDAEDLRFTPAQRGRLRHDRGVVEALERMWPVLTPEALIHDMLGWLPLIRDAGRGLIDDREAKLLHRPWSRRLADVAWTSADVCLLDEAAELLGPVPARSRPAEVAEMAAMGLSDAAMVDRVMADVADVDPVMRTDLVRHLARWSEAEQEEEGGMRTFGHAVIDEAQDLSPLQLRMLARRCPGGSMTLVGDLGQASRSWSASSWDEVLAQLPQRRPPRLVELTVNYRTPAEVMDLAARVLDASSAAATAPRSVRHSGSPPVLSRASTTADLAQVAVAAALHEQATIEVGKVAVLVAPGAGELAAAIRRSLSQPADEDEADALDEAISVMTTEGAKGLEFDSVVVVEPAAVAGDGPAGLRGLYVALTRTTRRLHIVCSEDLPPPLVGPGAIMDEWPTPVSP